MPTKSSFCQAFLVACAVLPGAFGCVGQNRLAKTLSEKEQLVSRVADEMKVNDELKAELVESNRRAADAERQLARLLDPRDPVGSKLAKSIKERRRTSDLEPRYATNLGGDSSPRKKPTVTPELRTAIEKMPNLRVDDRSGSIVFRGDVRFDSSDRPDDISKRRLNELARFLQSPEGNNLQVEITGLDITRAEGQRNAGHARASAVAAHLWQNRVSRQRIVVDSRNGTPLEDGEGRPLPTTKEKVEIVLVPSDVFSARHPAGGDSSVGKGRSEHPEEESGNWTAVER
jgi:hypothetical protein